tara:strand:+ start:440 stop:580 length:141 start_codon:yes stop_codon:yes gene_type:complete
MNIRMLHRILKKMKALAVLSQQTEHSSNFPNGDCHLSADPWRGAGQ